jgi:methionyl-tRNA formyltransferase
VVEAVKLVFCGTPSFAVPTLEALLCGGPRNRAGRLAARPPRGPQRSNSPLRPSSWPRWPPAFPSRSRKRFATTPSFARSLRPSRPTPSSSSPTAASFRPGCWRCPRLGCINLHGSLLPKYRGAAPIQWAVAMGDAFTGNTTMLLEEGLDTGPILLQQTVEIGPSRPPWTCSSAGQGRRAAGG